MKVKSESEVAQSCLTLSNHMDCSLPGLSIHGNFQARVLEWGALAFSKGTVYESANQTNAQDRVRKSEQSAGKELANQSNVQARS